MGFPLSQTPIYSLLNALLELQIEGFNTKNGRYQYKQVISILKHAYTRQLTSEAEILEKELSENNRFYPLPSELQKDDFLSHLFTPVHGIRALSQYLSETIQKIASINQSEEKD